MNNESSPKALASISLCVSSLSAIISGAAIALNAPRYSQLGFDYTAVIIAAFALIVTALIGLQVAQYIFSGDRMQRIAKDTAEPIASKTAKEVADSVSKEIANKAAEDAANIIAKNVAQKIAKDTVTLITGDLKHIMDALSPLVNARINTALGFSLRAIGWYCDSLDQCSHIQDSNLRQEYISRLFVEFLHHAEKWKEADRLCADQSLLDTYISLLDKFDNPESAKLKELIRSSREETAKDRVFDRIMTL